MKASFVLVNYNRREELLLTIEKTKYLIENSIWDYEIVIVDNASSDGSAEAVKANHPDVVLIENKVNTGAPAWNLGFAKAQGEYFIIIDDDSHVVSGLDDAINHLDKKPDIGILALNVTTGPYTSEGWRWKDGQDIVGFIGCGAIFRKSVYDKIGGYADWIFLYANEWDLGIRTIDAGYRVEYFAKCKVDHRTSAVHRSTKRLRVLCTKHELGIIYKHFPKSRWKYLIRVLINNLKTFKKGELKETWYNIIGFYEFFKMRKNLTYTPISLKSQKIFINHFIGTRFVIAFFYRFRKKKDDEAVLQNTAIANP
ncbi:glycosyltransferase [uncultured Mucilaginibacter sp.]|uniref:glycosyltransferase family 2 protein n=1 Tax=uncultured Mucilaginibacter sp. TaxID=797541 RepID=UPI00262ADFE0|nr:glycosyltransferase [uncultured Mucilaginibacter sp.]